MPALAHINTHTHREQFIHTLTEQVRRVVGSSWLTGVFCTYFFSFLLFGFFLRFCFVFVSVDFVVSCAAHSLLLSLLFFSFCAIFYK